MESQAIDTENIVETQSPKRLWLKMMRVSKDMSQIEVAKAIHTNQVTYSQIESGKINPSVQTAKRLGDFFGFDWTRFYEEK